MPDNVSKKIINIIKIIISNGNVCKKSKFLLMEMLKKS